MNKAKLTKRDFDQLFPTEDICLQELFEKRYADKKTCDKCKRPFKYHKLKALKLYSCQFCGLNIAPTAGTIFHKSSTPLTDWFYIIYLFSISKNGLSAMEIQRQFGYTYKTAWRVANRVRYLFDQTEGGLKNTVEFDETYVGGKGGHNKRGRGSENKTPVFGMLERKGEVIAKVTADTKRKTVMPLIREHVELGADVMTDEYLPYRSLGKEGYNHQSVNHGSKEYVRGVVHTNSLEGFWSQLKRSIHGTYHCVSPKYLQAYVNEFSFRYNHRNVSLPIFFLLLEKASKPL